MIQRKDIAVDDRYPPEVAFIYDSDTGKYVEFSEAKECVDNLRDILTHLLSCNENLNTSEERNAYIKRALEEYKCE